MDQRIKTRHLRAFVEIVSRGSFKQAAEALSLTQPSISKTMAELEELTGQPLLTRSRAGISLTEPGAVFLHYARLSLGALQQGLDSLEQHRRGPAKRLSIGALPSVAARLMPQVVREVQRIDPNIVLHIQDGPHGYLLDLLRAGKLDLVIGRAGAAAAMQGVSFAQLYQETVSIVLRPDHPLLHDPDLARLPDWQVILPPRHAAIYPIVQEFLSTHGLFDFPNRLDTVSGAFARIYVQRSDAVWLVSSGVAATEVEGGRLAVLPVDMSATTGAIGLMTRFSEPESPLMPPLKTAISFALGRLGLG